MTMMTTHEAESVWLMALASKCQSLTPINTLILAFVFLLSWLILTLIVWAHPGGSAWGRLKRTSTTPIPGPKGLPIIGSINLMAGLAHRNLASMAEAFRAKRLMAFSLGETRALVTCNPDVARDILNSSAFVDRPAKESAYELMFNRSMGFSPYGLYWKTLRKIASAHLFCPNQIKASEHRRMEIANEVVAVLESKKHYGDIRVRDVLKQASLNHMMWSVFGGRYDVLELKQMVEEGYKLLGEVNWSDHLSFLADFDMQKIRFRCSQLVPRVKRFIGRIMEEHKAKAKAKGEDHHRDFVDVLLSLDTLSDSDIVSLLWEMIFRGTDTVAVLIEWILARLVLHPDVQSKVHEELDRVVGNSTVTESHLTELLYLTAVVKEVLRLHPPGPLLSWARMSIRDSLLDGHHIPAGTTAMVNMWAIARDPLIWPDPLDFKPERFLNNGEFSVLGSDLRLAPFGAGRRSCPGKTMGMTTVTYWVARLMHEFEFEGHQSVDLNEVLKLSSEMANPLLVSLRRRPTSI